MTNDVPWKAYFDRHQQLMKALANESNGPMFQEFCREQRAPEKILRLLCACCAWSKHNRPNFEKIIKELRSMSDTDLEFTKKKSAIPNSSQMSKFGTAIDTSNRYPSAQSNYDQKRSNRLAKQALYSSEEDD